MGIRNFFTSIKNFAAKQGQDASENTRIFAIKKDLSRYESDNSKLKSDINNLNNNIRYVENTKRPIVRGLNRDINYYNDEIILNYDKFLKISENTAATNLRMSEISKYNDELQKYTLNFKLVDINTKKNIYNLIKSENNLIEKNNLESIEDTDKNNQKYTYSLEQYNEIENINTLFFILFYFLFLIFLFIIIFKTNYSVLLKIIFCLIMLLYPYIIYMIETLFYNIIYFLYLYAFSIFTIENIH
jgi:hypothetical protein